MNVSELIERLRTHWESQRKAREADAKYDACCVDLGDEAAAALEAQAREIQDAALKHVTLFGELQTALERLAEAERNEGTLLGMIHHQLDVLRECLPYINESMAGRRPGRCADDIRAAVKALTADSGSGGEQ